MEKKKITNIEVKRKNRNDVFRYICKNAMASNPDISLCSVVQSPGLNCSVLLLCCQISPTMICLLRTTNSIISEVRLWTAVIVVEVQTGLSYRPPLRFLWRKGGYSGRMIRKNRHKNATAVYRRYLLRYPPCFCCAV